MFGMGLNNARNNTACTTYGIAKEIVDQVYRHEIADDTCYDVYTENPHFPECLKKEVLFDLRGIGFHCYSPSERIISDLETLGRVVGRGVIIDTTTIEKIKEVSR